MVEQTPLDISVLDENAELGIDGLHELIDEYNKQAEETIVGLREAIRAGKAENVNQLAHKLAGSSAVCGITGLVGPLRTLEQRGRVDELADADQLLNVVIERMELCRRLVDAYLAEKDG
jgi:HPt (histidine-containing phosphotransfer) domain-containing protein